jgi:hypothetical protein
MDMMAAQLAGLLLVLGTVAIFIAASAPTVLYDSYRSPDLRTRIDTIANHRTAWVLANVGYLAGIVATGIGLVVLAPTLGEPNANPLAWIGLVAIVLATLVGVVGVYLQVSLPPEKVLGTTGGKRAIRVFSLLTLGAFILFGAALLLAGFPVWLGAVTIGLSGLIVAVWIIWDNGIPPLYYLVSLIMGIALLIS